MFSLRIFSTLVPHQTAQDADRSSGMARLCQVKDTRRNVADESKSCCHETKQEGSVWKHTDDLDDQDPAGLMRQQAQQQSRRDQQQKLEEIPGPRDGQSKGDEEEKHR